MGLHLNICQKILSHHTFITNQYGEGISSDKTSHMTITYFARVVGVSPVFSEKHAHIVPTVHRSWWLLVALYKNWQVVTYIVATYTYIQDKYVCLFKFTLKLVRTCSDFLPFLNCIVHP